MLATDFEPSKQRFPVLASAKLDGIRAIVRDGVEQEVPVAQVKKGDVFVVRPGENIPVDGIILEGSIPSPANPPSGCKFHTRCRECMEICKTVPPKRYEAGNDHFVVCHLYGK